MGIKKELSGSKKAKDKKIKIKKKSLQKSLPNKGLCLEGAFQNTSPRILQDIKLERPNSSILKKCKNKLLQEKEDLLNKLKFSRLPPMAEETSGDAGDQNMRAMDEHQWLLFQSRLRKQLYEVESALSRLEKGFYGVCEETELPIESERLLAIPWTRLSIEGAKLREGLQK